MLLLKRVTAPWINAGINVFTFHYASIKTYHVSYSLSPIDTFTFHYASIKTEAVEGYSQIGINLHFTMLLLKRYLDGVQLKMDIWFTFHYASIKTYSRFKRFYECLCKFTFHYASIKTKELWE